MISEVFMPRHSKSVERIRELIEQEETYIWTDNKEFQNIMTSEFSKIISSDGFDIVRFKTILNEYYKTIVRNIRETVPKAIVFHLIRSCVDSMTSLLFEKVLGGDTHVLLEEFPEIEQRRKLLEKNRKELIELKRLIETIL